MHSTKGISPSHDHSSTWFEFPWHSSVDQHHLGMYIQGRFVLIILTDVSSGVAVEPRLKGNID